MKPEFAVPALAIDRPAVEERVPLKRLSVLLAEDEPLVRKLIDTVLRNAGYQVILAADGQEALELSRACRSHINLLISDVYMPGMDGAELATHLHRERPRTRVLLMSGYDRESELNDYILGCDFLPKPFLPQQLLDKISDLLNQPPSERVTECELNQSR